MFVHAPPVPANPPAIYSNAILGHGDISKSNQTKDISSVIFNDLSTSGNYLDNALDHSCLDVGAPPVYTFGIVHYHATFHPLALVQGKFNLTWDNDFGTPTVANFLFTPADLKNDLALDGTAILPYKGFGRNPGKICLKNANIPAYSGYYTRITIDYSSFWKPVQ